VFSAWVIAVVSEDSAAQPLLVVVALDGVDDAVADCPPADGDVVVVEAVPPVVDGVLEGVVVVVEGATRVVDVDVDDGFVAPSRAAVSTMPLPEPVRSAVSAHSPSSVVSWFSAVVTAA
jgi:hypothetical protein